MHLHRWLLLGTGTVACASVASYLTIHDAAPGLLSSVHDQIPGLTRIDGCDHCHRREGLAAGCLSCHGEIKSQLEGGRGFHSYLLRNHLQERLGGAEGDSLEDSAGDSRGEANVETSGGLDPRALVCQRCHLEHLEPEFPLTIASAWGEGGKDGFRHPHVAFSLGGKHEEIACEKCHALPDRAPFHLDDFPALERPATFLGLDEKCVSCHSDPHAGELTSACGQCHGQDAFRPAPKFEHDPFYVLGAAHGKVLCEGCHLLPERENCEVTYLSFRKLIRVSPANDCAGCHATPHRAAWSEGCEECHARSSSHWSAASGLLTALRHAETGYRLDPPHDRVDCAKCHPTDLPFAARYVDPAAPDYRRGQDDCAGCHPDIHEGQFAASGKGCLDCHQRIQWTPARYGLADHVTFVLSGSHLAVPCIGCHRVDPASGVRVFASTPRECKVCHADPHDGQFRKELERGDCTVCHEPSSSTFSIRPFDHLANTGYPLNGAHARASCEGCHSESTPGPTPARVDRALVARVPAEPVPAVSAAADSAPEPSPEPSPGAVARRFDAGIVPAVRARRFRGVSRECSGCHEDVHRGQFRRNLTPRAGLMTAVLVACDGCHPSTEAWKDLAFDHDRQSDFPLDGSHRKVACDRCHPKVKVGAGRDVVQYRPIPHECKDCHVFSKI